MRPDTRTPEQRRADLLAEVERKAQVLDEAHARHAAVLERARLHSSITAAVLDLHGPELPDSAFRPICEGCDWGPGDAEPPEWPCTTWTLIADELSV